MLSKKLHDALNEQINAELWSAYLYLSMSMDAEAKGLKGVANWFFVQFQEEQDHARILMNYINSRDAKVELKPIAEQVEEEESARDMITACEAVEGNKFGLYTLDKELAARVYQQASPLAANNA